MKRFISVLFVCSICTAVFAIPITFGAKVGTNMNSNHENHYAFVTGLFCDFQVTKYIYLGAQTDFSTDFFGNNVIAPFAYGMFTIGEKSLKKSGTFMPFLQLNAGIAVMGIQNKWLTQFYSAADIGIRINVRDFVFGPYVSVGYPFKWGCGVFFCYKFLGNSASKGIE
ncbi:MAG: hypothetical protein ACTTHG_04805 [Treponemataceae bacterium]